MVIKALDHVHDCYSWDTGAVIGDMLRSAFARNESVVLSFQGVTDVPSSFVNAALISLLDSYSFDFIKAHLRVTDASHQIVDMIQRRFSFATKKPLAA